MKILALESYYGGSHKAFLDGLSQASSHSWTKLTLPAHKWKWRMRHSAIYFSQQVRELATKGHKWDLIFCSDMLNLAEFAGLVPERIALLPKVMYFHENQLTYPVRVEDERDYQFAMTNLTSALAADAVWFNSKFHMDSFFDALAKFLKSMPDFRPMDSIENIRSKSSIFHPGIGDFPTRIKRQAGPMRILWAARWEHDKNPQDFFAALEILKSRNIDFKISVIGQSFRDVPEVFEKAKNSFKEHIQHWGYQKSRKEYESILSESDAVVSTANHEFFGISILEAIASGAYPLVPERLSYPEILNLDQNKNAEQFFYDGTVKDLAAKLELLASRFIEDKLLPGSMTLDELVERYKWQNLIHKYDNTFGEMRRE